MVLFIDTTKKELVILRLSEKGEEIINLEEKHERAQAEKLLPALSKVLKKINKTLADIKEIEVNNDGGTFTSLRIGVITANALAFALDIPIKGVSGRELNKKGLTIVKPKYNAKPQIS